MRLVETSRMGGMDRGRFGYVRLTGAPPGRGSIAWAMRAPRTFLGALGLAAAIWVCAAPAFAQTTIERHPVVVAPPSQGRIAIDAASYGSDDTTPYGVALSGVTLIGENDAVATAPAVGIVVTGAPQPEGRSDLHSALEAALRPFLRAPLSAHEIAALQATVAGVYRAAGFPFTSVTVPPQEITSGVLQLRVVTFRAGIASISSTTGGDLSNGAAIRNGVRLQEGEIIDGRQLSEDIDWLNRNPYRHVSAVFSPGSETAAADLSLEVAESKPWTLTAGWSNTGSESTGLQRYSIGAGLYLPKLGDTMLSYLLTGGDDLLLHPDKIALRDGDYPQYLSHAGRVVVPTLPRQQIEFTPSLVATRQDLDFVTSVQNLTYELPVTYRTAVSNLLPGHYWGDFYAGVALKGLNRKVYFAGSEAASGSAGLLQAIFGWSNTIADRTGDTAIDLSLVVNPGGLIPNSDDAAWSTYTGGRVTSSSYGYGVLNLTRRTNLSALFGQDGYSWISQFTGMMAGAALPDTEQLALGGLSGSRAYSFSEVSVDRGIVWRNELRLPTLSVPNALNASASPYLFADLAWGENLSTNQTDTLVSLGIGADVSLGDNVTGGLTVGRAMTDAGTAKAGDWSAFGKLSVKF